MHNAEEAEAKFRQVYAESIGDYQEGVVLKADDSGYNRVGRPWVKLKRDYIQGKSSYPSCTPSTDLWQALEIQSTWFYLVPDGAKIAVEHSMVISNITDFGLFL